VSAVTTSPKLGAVKVLEGGEGEALSFSGEVLHVVLSRAYAPGAPITLELAHPTGPLSLRGKTIGSKRRAVVGEAPVGEAAAPSFDVRLRVVSLRREERARLEGGVPRSDAGPGGEG
jgi:hypothetical protein